MNMMIEGDDIDDQQMVPSMDGQLDNYPQAEREIYFFESSISQTYMDFVKNEVGIGPMVTP